ncbi:hypothetical protein EJ02DRAFT_35462 [Clathrospora elynae]|uniref:Uncharacterized protein n=1 Tax=Clathrospora elynae TaxID=706981 RepID=A0A6A5T9S8_9PLEO|nr:hypothetical protein EJ02DRAFT_35462 [Clathrospora elynae]
MRKSPSSPRAQYASFLLCFLTASSPTPSLTPRGAHKTHHIWNALDHHCYERACRPMKLSRLVPSLSEIPHQVI